MSIAGGLDVSIRVGGVFARLIKKAARHIDCNTHAKTGLVIGLRKLLCKNITSIASTDATARTVLYTM